MDPATWVAVVALFIALPAAINEASKWVRRPTSQAPSSSAPQHVVQMLAAAGPSLRGRLRRCHDESERSAAKRRFIDTILQQLKPHEQSGLVYASLEAYAEAAELEILQELEREDFRERLRSIAPKSTGEEDISARIQGI